jgi:CRP-like cAMP-binding protein
MPQRLAKKLSLHTALAPDVVAELDRLVGQSIQYPAGASIAKVGDEADVVTVVQEGFVCRTNVLEDGRRQIHSLFLPGDTADGETPLLGNRVDNLDTLSRCSVWLIPKARFFEVVQSQPQLAEAFVREAAIAAQIAREWVVNIGRRTALERIAHLFCELHARMAALGMTSEQGFVLPLTQHDIADAQGLSAVHVNRVLQDLRARGLIRTERQRLVILDHPRLCKLAVGDFTYLHLPKMAEDSPL